MTIHIAISTPKIGTAFPINGPNHFLDGVDRAEVEGWKTGDSVLSVLNQKHQTDIFITKNYQAILAGAYSDIFYKRIIITPLVIELGNLVTEKTYEIKISNLYFESKTLLSVIVKENEGISLVGPALPLIIKQLDTVTFILTVSLSGPPQIGASFEFGFTNSEDNAMLSVSGSRMVIFPYQYKPGMIETMSWNTNVLKSRDGTEQRIKARTAARQSFQFDSYTSNTEYIRLKNLLYGWRSRGWALPFFFEEKVLTATTSANSKRLNFNTKFANFELGGLGVVYKDQRIFEVFQIVELHDDYIITRQELVNDYEIGTMVYPVRIARIIGNPIRSTTGWNSTLSINFESVDNVDSPKADPMPIQYKNLDVLLDPRLEVLKVSDKLPIVYDQRVDEIDYQTGKVDFFGVGKYMEEAKTIRFIIEGIEEIWYFKSWLRRRSGKLIPFWLPTFEPDIQIVTEGFLESSVLAINNEYQTQATLRNNVAIILKDGSFIFREIIGSDINNNGQTEISFNLSLGIKKEDIDTISYMGVNRFDSDNINMTWFQGNKIICDIPIREISPQ